MVPADRDETHRTTVGFALMSAPLDRRLRRDTTNKMLGGVCAGIARRFGISVGGLRLAFVLSCVLPGPQILAYLLLWILIPADRRY
jgi:phage shock protein PspC (stress-responsive transcriptional regulator)